jgi:uncharacterized protein
MPSLRTLVTGATGLVGKALLPRLEHVVVAARDPERARRDLPGIAAHRWAGADEAFPAEALRDVGTIVHLAGEPVAEGRWSADKKRRIRDSRVLGTRRLVAALAATTPRPEVLVSASAVGFYGDRGDEELDETSPAGRDFLADVCTAWEAEAHSAEALGVRVVSVRFGIVLAARGGALARMLPAFRMGLGGRLGDGRQWMSFVHLDDAVGLLVHACQDTRCRGALNAVAPQPVTNRQFTQTLAQVLHRPAALPVPSLALRLAFGELASALTSSQRVLPRVAERTGYQFAYRELTGALTAALATT